MYRSSNCSCNPSVTVQHVLPSDSKSILVISLGGSLLSIIVHDFNLANWFVGQLVQTFVSPILTKGTDLLSRQKGSLTTVISVSQFLPSCSLVGHPYNVQHLVSSKQQNIETYSTAIDVQLVPMPCLLQQLFGPRLAVHTCTSGGDGLTSGFTVGFAVGLVVVFTVGLDVGLFVRLEVFCGHGQGLIFLTLHFLQLVLVILQFLIIGQKPLELQFLASRLHVAVAFSLSSCDNLQIGVNNALHNLTLVNPVWRRQVNRVSLRFLHSSFRLTGVQRNLPLTRIKLTMSKITLVFRLMLRKWSVILFT